MCLACDNWATRDLGSSGAPRSAFQIVSGEMTKSTSGTVTFFTDGPWTIAAKAELPEASGFLLAGGGTSSACSRCLVKNRAAHLEHVGNVLHVEEALYCGARFQRAINASDGMSFNLDELKV